MAMRMLRWSPEVSFLTTAATELLTHPTPCGHIVYPYTNEDQVAEAVSLFAGSGLRDGEAVILLMTRDHCQPIRDRLESEGVDVPMMESTGQLVCVEAEDLMSRFIFDGIIDEHRFKTIVGDLIEKAKKFSTQGISSPVRVFGEMVSLMWRDNLRSTARLEELWNEVIASHSVPLLCAYALAGSLTPLLPKSLLSLHSHAIV
jgi:hypothetical protein